MDLDKALVMAVLREGKKGLRAVLDTGVHSGVMSGEGKRAFACLVEYTKLHGDLPTQEVLSQKAEVGLDSSMTGHALHWAEAIINRRLARSLEDAMVEVGSKILKPKEALAHLEEVMVQLRKDRLAGSLIESLPAQGASVMEYYERIEKGETGIPTPWKSIDDSTLGFWPEDLVLFVARLGIGKTWTSIFIADTAWNHKIKLPDGTERPCRVLYATTEMAKARIAMRWYAYRLKFPYGQVRKAQLGAFGKQKFFDGVKALMNAENLHIVGGDFDFSMESFDAAVEEANPDIVVLDGAYLLKVPGLTRQERAANVFDELKRLNKRRKVPIIVTMQFNREVKTNQAKTVAAESIALTDVAGWNADLIYGLIQTDEMKKNKRLMLKPLKIREGEGDEIECNWDFDTMNFSELPKAKGSGSGGGSGGGSDAAESLGSGQADPFAAPGEDVPF